MGNFDPRIVANYILQNSSHPVRQIALNKLLYFSHGMFLVRTKSPLVKGYFEAWKFGPVHPAIYSAFKDWGREPIKKLAEGKDLRTGELRPLPQLDDRSARDVVDRALQAYSDYTDGQLVDLSHAPGGPWDAIMSKAKHQSMIGLKIPNDLILSLFGRHKLSSCRLAGSGDVYDEDAPITYNGFG